MNPIHTCPKDGTFFILIEPSGASYPAWWNAKQEYPLCFIDDQQIIRISDDAGDWNYVLVNGYKPPWDNPRPLHWLPWPEIPSPAPLTSTT